MEHSAPDSPFVSLCQNCGVSGNLAFWQSLVESLAARDGGLRRNDAGDDDPDMESGVSVIAELIADTVNEKPDWEPPYRTAIEVLRQAGLERPTNAQCREAGSILRELFGPPKRVRGREQWRVSFKGDEVSERF